MSYVISILLYTQISSALARAKLQGRLVLTGFVGAELVAHAKVEKLAHIVISLKVYASALNNCNRALMRQEVISVTQRMSRANVPQQNQPVVDLSTALLARVQVTRYLLNCCPYN